MSLVGFCRRSVICGLIAAAALIFAGSAILSQEQYPSANVEIVVPFAAGGAVDVTGRVVAQALSKALARTFVVINQPGANSNIGNLAVVPDLPTFKEQGVDFTMGTWFGLLAPRSTPQSVIDTLARP